MTSYSSFWQDYGGFDNAGGAVYDELVNKDSVIKKIAHKFRSKGNRKTARLLRTLIGAATGATATETFYETPVMTQFDGTSLSGKLPAVKRTIIDRATTASDVTALDALTDTKFKPSTYPADKSGNGGGGKSGTF